MINFPAVHCPDTMKSVCIVLILAMLFFLCVIPQGLKAQQVSSVITYQDSMMSDEEGGALLLPSFVYVEPFTKEIYLIDGKSRILIYTPDLFPLYTLGKNVGVEAPQGLTIDRDGSMYVAQAVSENNPKNRISVFNACLKWERDIYIKGFEGADSFTPYRIAADKNKNLYVASNNFHGVLFVNNTGRLMEIISPEEEGKKVTINSVILDREEKLYLVSEDQGRIYIYDQDRKFIMKFGEKGGSSGKLSRPKAVGVDDIKGRMYVVDYMRHTINVYNEKGAFIFEFGGRGWGKGWFYHPVNIAIDSEGRILVADLFNHRVQVLHSW